MGTLASGIRPCILAQSFFLIGILSTWVPDKFFAFGVCSNKVICWQCDSRHDPDCKDPWNKTSSQLRAKDCHGCCVKLTGVEKQKSFIIRGCTSDPSLEIDPYFYSHSCFPESRSVGLLCFCERDRCNAAHSSLITTAHWTRILASLSFLALLYFSIIFSETFN